MPLVLVSLMPRFDRFQSLRNPVRWNLALHAASLRRRGPGIRRRDGRRVRHPEAAAVHGAFWASDGFHPGPDGYREWVEFALGAVPAELLDAPSVTRFASTAQLVSASSPSPANDDEAAFLLMSRLNQFNEEKRPHR